MKIHLVRHGKTTYNKQGLLSGHSDVTLVEEGIEEVKNTSKSLDNDYSIIYSSDLIRCKQTADILNEKLKLPIVYDARLREGHLGSFQGKKREEFFAAVGDNDPNRMHDFSPYGGESVEQIKERVAAFLDQVREQKKGEKILVVTSAGVIHVAHLILEKNMPERIHNASVHEFELSDL